MSTSLFFIFYWYLGCGLDWIPFIKFVYTYTYAMSEIVIIIIYYRAPCPYYCTISLLRRPPLQLTAYNCYSRCAYVTSIVSLYIRFDRYCRFLGSNTKTIRLIYPSIVHRILLQKYKWADGGIRIKKIWKKKKNLNKQIGERVSFVTLSLQAGFLGTGVFESFIIPVYNNENAFGEIKKTKETPHGFVVWKWYNYLRVHFPVDSFL